MWIHKYQLHPVNSLNSRSNHEPRLGFFIKNFEGATPSSDASTEILIKKFLNFSDFLHWPELGDPPLADLKDVLLKTSEADFKFPFDLTEKDLMTVKSNGLISDFGRRLGQEMEILQDGKFEVVKFKMGGQFKDEYTALMKNNLKSYLVRIDFNNCFNFKEAKEALTMLKKIPNLEYIEDPTHYDDYQWSELEKITPLALDRFSKTIDRHPLAPKTKEPQHFQYRIVKPLRGISVAEILQWTIDKKKIVLTNMMDNVVGAWKTYFYYCELKKQFPYHIVTPGFHTHTLFHDYKYASLLGFQGSQWTFDKNKLLNLLTILDTFHWIRLNYLDGKTLEQILKETQGEFR